MCDANVIISANRGDAWQCQSFSSPHEAPDTCQCWHTTWRPWGSAWSWSRPPWTWSVFLTWPLWSDRRQNWDKPDVIVRYHIRSLNWSPRPICHWARHWPTHKSFRPCLWTSPSRCWDTPSRSWAPAAPTASWIRGIWAPADGQGPGLSFCATPCRYNWLSTI